MATINEVRLDRPVEFSPNIVEGIHGRPVDDMEPLFLNPFDAKILITSICDSGQIHVIEETLQTLCERIDGTKLKSAFPSLELITRVFQKLSPVPDALIQEFDKWERVGCNEVMIHFEEKV